MAERIGWMPDEEFAAFRDRIRDHDDGTTPATVHEGKIVDGKHLWRARAELGRPCPTVPWDGVGSLLDFILRRNLWRRHLALGQKALLAMELMPEFEAEARQRQLAVLRKGENAPEHSPMSGRRARDHAAEAAGLKGGGRTLGKVMRVAKYDREHGSNLLQLLRDGKTPTQVEREMVLHQKAAARAEQQRLVDAHPDLDADSLFARGVRWPTIVLDPPWQMGAERSLLGTTYPTMSLDAIRGHLGRTIEKLAMPDSHVWLWTTDSLLLESLLLLRDAGLRHARTFIWSKAHGCPTPWGVQAHEYLILSTLGSQPALSAKARTVFEGRQRVRTHSSKPLRAYELIESISPPRYLSMYDRGNARRNWTFWGSEVKRRRGQPLIPD